VLRAFMVLLAVQGIGSAGYFYLGWRFQEGLWGFWECLYMTAVTVSTVGFGEILDVTAVPGGREWTLALLIFGVSANLYVLSSLTSFILEGDFTQMRRYRSRNRRMQRMKGHYIVCGVGTTGQHVVRELVTVGEKVVAIDLEAANLTAVDEKKGVPLQADATDDEVLARAGIDRAKGIVAALDDDKTNMFVVVSARQANPEIRIVAKAVSQSAAEKLRRAGADAVVSPNFIGGLRLASELLRPQVVRFLDQMLREDSGLRIEEATVGRDGPAVGKTLGSARLRDTTGCLVLAIREPDGKVTHSPPASAVVEAGQTLIAIGTHEQIVHLRQLVGARAHSQEPTADQG
jgi:voltage-gated potassium channel